jgi:hypothetical protein
MYKLTIEYDDESRMFWIRDHDDAGGEFSTEARWASRGEAQEALERALKALAQGMFDDQRTESKRRLRRP